MTDKNLAMTQNVVTFRQTWNLWSKNWQIPKRLGDDGKWYPINRKNLNVIVTKQQGYAFALWRMQKVMAKIRDEHNLAVWKVSGISKERVTWNGLPYSIFQFSCHRIAHGIIGGMNTARGAS